MTGYILLRVQSGFNDGVFLIHKITEYAIKHDRTIILTFELYSATKLDTIFDFSNYPVPVICGEDIVPSLKYTAIEPACYGMNPYTEATSRTKNTSKLINGVDTKFDLTKTYPPTTLLIWDSLGAREHSMFQIFNTIRLTRIFISKFQAQRQVFPEVFNAIHVRGTDDPIKNKSKTMTLVHDFVMQHPIIPIYLASDDMQLLDEIACKYTIVQRPLSYKQIDVPYHSLHHSFGKNDPECLTNAIVDVLMCASSRHFLRSTGGFSGLIEKFHAHPEVLTKLLQL